VLLYDIRVGQAEAPQGVSTPSGLGIGKTMLKRLLGRSR
jgi:hypothetical protein